MPRYWRGTRWSLTCTGVLIVCLCAPSQAESQPVALQIEAVKSTLLAGEPVVLLVTVKSDLPLDLESDLTFSTAPLKVLINRGQGFTPYTEKVWSSEDRDGSKRRLERGEERFEHVLAVDDKTEDWVFPAPGTYQLVAEYQDDTLGPVRSNVLSVVVQAPTGDEKVIHDALRVMGPDVLGEHVSSFLYEMAPLIANHPLSVYVQRPRLLELGFRRDRLLSGYDPALNLLPEEDPPLRPNLRPDVQRAWRQDLLPKAEALVQTAGQFEPEALLELAGLYEGLGDHETASRLYRDIIERFPRRKAAQLARLALGDTSAPRLALGVAPASLWPPNHKLASIAVTVEVTDDLDPSPSVKLLSITCDDACDPATDISGATYGTDDRHFELRSERRGTSAAGRTYTITYSAEDAAGNNTTSTTAVVVAHDKGKKK